MGGKCELEGKVADSADRPDHEDDKERFYGDLFCRLPLQAADADNQGDGNRGKDGDLPDLDERLAKRLHGGTEIAKEKACQDTEKETYQYPESEACTGQFHGRTPRPGEPAGSTGPYRLPVSGDIAGGCNDVVMVCRPAVLIPAVVPAALALNDYYGARYLTIRAGQQRKIIRLWISLISSRVYETISQIWTPIAASESPMMKQQNIINPTTNLTPFSGTEFNSRHDKRGDD